MTRYFKSTAAAVLACGLALSAPGAANAAGVSALAGLKGSAAQSNVIEVRRGRGAGIALGILGAAAATAIIAGSARAHDRHYYGERHYYRSYGGPSCRELRWRCNDGSSWACRKYYNRCDY
ncbi:MAG: hypothetical protein ACK4MF_04530 [Hyphomicrobiaceae bacterium]